MATMEINAAMVKKLRDATGAGMMECKAALTEANGDLDAATTLLRKRGLAAADQEGRTLDLRGLVGHYIHMGGKIGVLVEINCESDFVARTDKFQELAKEIAMHIAAANPTYVRREDVPADLVAREREIYKRSGQGQAGAGHRQDRRGQVEQLLPAVLPPGAGVGPRPQRHDRAAGPGRHPAARREHHASPASCA